MSGPPDAQLVRAAARGDEAAWGELVDRHAGLVWSVARGCGLATHYAAEVSQATWRHLASQLGRIHDPSHVGEWLAVRAADESRLRLTRGGPGRRARTSPAF